MPTNKTFNKVQLDVKFTQAETRANIVSEENISISFGKISKMYSDLHSSAFNGYGLSISNNTLSITEGGGSTSVSIPNDKVLQKDADNNIYPVLFGAQVIGDPEDESDIYGYTHYNNSIYGFGGGLYSVRTVTEGLTITDSTTPYAISMHPKKVSITPMSSDDPFGITFKNLQEPNYMYQYLVGEVSSGIYFGTSLNEQTDTTRGSIQTYMGDGSTVYPMMQITTSLKMSITAGSKSYNIRKHDICGIRTLNSAGVYVASDDQLNIFTNVPNLNDLSNSTFPLIKYEINEGDIRLPLRESRIVWGPALENSINCYKNGDKIYSDPALTNEITPTFGESYLDLLTYKCYRYLTEFEEKTSVNVLMGPQIVDNDNGYTWILPSETGALWLNGSAGNGSLLTDLNASNISSGVLSASYGGTGYTSLQDSMINLTKALATSSTTLKTTDYIVINSGTGVTRRTLSTTMSFIRTQLMTSTTPKAPGTAAVGTSTYSARADHVHPLQTDVTGNAGSADKLNTNAGDSTIPVYFSNGIPVACNDDFVYKSTNQTITGKKTFNDVTDLSGFTNIGNNINPSSNPGWLHLMDIKLIGTYARDPVIIKVATRNNVTDLHLRFSNASSAAGTNVAYFRAKTLSTTATLSKTNFEIIRISDTTFEIWYKRLEDGDGGGVISINTNGRVKQTMEFETYKGTNSSLYKSEANMATYISSAMSHTSCDVLKDGSFDGNLYSGSVVLNTSTYVNVSVPKLFIHRAVLARFKNVHSDSSTYFSFSTVLPLYAIHAVNGEYHLATGYDPANSEASGKCVISCKYVDDDTIAFKLNGNNVSGSTIQIRMDSIV